MGSWLGLLGKVFRNTGKKTWADEGFGGGGESEETGFE